MADDISFLLQSVHHINMIISNIDRLINESNNQMDFGLVLDKLDYVQRMVVNLDVDDFITETIGRACRLLLESKRNTKSSAGSGYRARVQHDGQRGRPLFAISKEQLCYLVDQGFKVEEIGTMLGVSGRTVKRRGRGRANCPFM